MHICLCSRCVVCVPQSTLIVLPVVGVRKGLIHGRTAAVVATFGRVGLSLTKPQPYMTKKRGYHLARRGCGYTPLWFGSHRRRLLFTHSSSIPSCTNIDKYQGCHLKTERVAQYCSPPKHTQVQHRLHTFDSLPVCCLLLSPLSPLRFADVCNTADSEG